VIIVVAVMANSEDRDVAIFNVGMRDVTRAFDFEKRYMPRFAEGNNPLPQEGIGIVHFAARKREGVRHIRGLADRLERGYS